MRETGSSNIEAAHHLSHHGATTSGHQVLELIEALVLAVVAIATAWSGYQAALWNERQLELFNQAGELRVEAEGAAAIANQERLYLSSVVTEWAKAEARGDLKLAEFFDRRVLPEFRSRFEAWKNTDPLNNPQALAGPVVDFETEKSETSGKLNKHASQIFAVGVTAGHSGDNYVRVTVLLATVLLLTAISQRFRIPNARLALAIFSAALLSYCVYRIVTLPQL